MEDPLDYVDFVDVVAHGDPSRWIYVGPKAGSPLEATSSYAHEGSMKHYDLYRDTHGQIIEVHYIRHVDGSVVDVKVIL
jgi:hypothetical protein